MNTRGAILRSLADGKLHSGADIGRKLGITRAAVSKGVKALVANGLDVRAVPGLGYRLQAPLMPLDRRAILRRLERSGTPVRRIEVLEKADSTSAHLLAQALADPVPSGAVCLAEVQPRGRGRHGKSWVATPYENLMLSMVWRFATGPAMVAGLSLAAGVAVVRALEDCGVSGAGLKWPNDVLLAASGGRSSRGTRTPLPGVLSHTSPAQPGAAEGRKLAGLLVDVHGEAGGPCTIVLGVGVNCRIADADALRIDQPWVDLYTILGGAPDRNRLAAALIHQLYVMFTTFAASGFAAFRGEWDRRHLYANRPVRMWRDKALFEGTVEGIDENGGLRLRRAGGDTHVFYSGEVSLRPIP